MDNPQSPRAQGREARSAKKIVFDVVLPVVMSIGPNIAASIIYDAAKSFFKRRPGGGLVFNLVFPRESEGH